MRRDARRRVEYRKWWKDRNFIIIVFALFALISMIVWIAIYTNKIPEDLSNSEISTNQKISLESEKEIKNDTESASSTIGKTVNEVEKEDEVQKEKIEENKLNNETTNNDKKQKNNETSNQNTEKSNSSEKTSITSSNVENNSISFEWPIKGEIIKTFSIDNLLYSTTLQEWTIHNGVDIKADKSQVVCSAADGVIKSIKNDPRFGLSVTIEHLDGFKTIYANLSTAEFVVEGENVKTGQTIGTVGNSANFEIADESHLHFEIQKDGEYVDPTIFLK